MLAVNGATRAGRRRFRRSAYCATFALAGFLDVLLCSRLFAHADAVKSLSWGVAGAAGYALTYLLIHVTAVSLGVDPDPAFEPESDTEPGHEEDVPWWSDLGWKALAGLLVMGAVVALFAAFVVKTIVVVLVFAAFTAPSFGEVVLVIVASGALQMLAQHYIVDPIAARHGIAL
ncbi:hypothetical protein [Aeromicrobium sp. Leaf350]|uniref:hypothetical protein n=1 Tax=Aeromicrobium sp. Leaf350 TaxID=2876565 RepID=UPI001E520E4A|nr:hypothetical protein [Aeromicrobium sp. Leaf350]